MQFSGPHRMGVVVLLHLLDPELPLKGGWAFRRRYGPAAACPQGPSRGAWQPRGGVPLQRFASAGGSGIEAGPAVFRLPLASALKLSCRDSLRGAVHDLFYYRDGSR